MRKSLVLAGFCTVVLAVGVPEARAGTGWLEKLSGPGPFFGLMLPIPIRCDAVGKTDEPVISSGKWGCSGAPKGMRRIISVEVWQLSTDHNQLPYDRDVDTGVSIFGTIGTIEFMPWKQFKVGSGFGVAWISGDAFDTFARPVAQPVRLTVAPLSLISPGTKGLEILKVHMNSNILLGGVDASDFGARGNFEAPYELQWSLSLEADFWPLLKFGN
jgi:hypothetical protein